MIYTSYGYILMGVDGSNNVVTNNSLTILYTGDLTHDAMKTLCQDFKEKSTKVPIKGKKEMI